MAFITSIELRVEYFLVFYVNAQRSLVSKNDVLCYSERLTM